MHILVLIVSLTLALTHATDVVHYVSMNHLDVGFSSFSGDCTNSSDHSQCPFARGLIHDVVNRYFDVYFPLAVATAETLRARGGPERHVYTTHSWLASLYLDCPSHPALHCPNASALDAFQGAIRRGDITWHALPFNAQVSLFDEDLLAAAVALTHSLDDSVQQPHKRVMSQRDVPGLSVASLPTLHRSGVRVISVGTNPASSPPAVPAAFLWHHSQHPDERMLALWHPHGYGGLTTQDCTILAGAALCLSVRGDNRGGPAPWEVLNDFAQLRSEFPNATIIASSFDAWANSVLPHLDSLQLPLLTTDIDDTWTYGIPSDPLKHAQFRAFKRARQWCVRQVASSECLDVANTRASLAHFDRFLIKVPEHTSGMDAKRFLTNLTENWTNSEFNRMRANDDKGYRLMEASWHDQRSVLDWALATLASDSPLRMRIDWELAQLKVSPVTATPVSRRVAPNERFDCGSSLRIGFDSSHGYVSYLERSGAVLIDDTQDSRSRAFALLYQTLDSADVTAFLDAYLDCDPHQPGGDCNSWNFGPWPLYDLGKEGLAKTHAKHSESLPTLQNVHLVRNETSGECAFTIDMEFNRTLARDYGAPEKVKMHLTTHSNEIEVVLELFAKGATRLPESLSLQVRPTTTEHASSVWTIHKLGVSLLPTHIASNATHHQHLTDETGVSLTHHGRLYRFASLDVPTVIFNEPLSPLPTPLNTPFQPDAGFAWNIHNNLYDTNYPLWYPFDEQDANSHFRFRLTLEDV